MNRFKNAVKLFAIMLAILNSHIYAATFDFAKAEPIKVEVSPDNITLNPGQQQQFSAKVTGTSNTAVTWRALGGTITSTGLYTAPLATGAYELLANSVVDRTKVGAALITVASNPPSEPNLALNKPTVASSEEAQPSHPAFHATDSDINTRWCAIDGRSGNWLKVDLGKQCNLTGTQIKWENSYLWKYKIEVSTDNLQWTTVVDRTNGTITAQTYLDIFNGYGRYIRITSVSNTGSQWASIYDFKVYGTEDTAASSDNQVNLALNKITTASSQENNIHAPFKATDSDTMMTSWKALDGNDNQWIMVDLGTPTHLNQTRIKWGNYDVWRYRIEISTDGFTWEIVADKTTNTIPSQIYEDMISGSAKYVRIVVPKHPSGSATSIYDFEVFGH